MLIALSRMIFIFSNMVLLLMIELTWGKIMKKIIWEASSPSLSLPSSLPLFTLPLLKDKLRHIKIFKSLSKNQFQSGSTKLEMVRALGRQKTEERYLEKV